ncbi:hypothetical protein QQ020_11505 [Fulvivirgaceae bacterium BMA12]|uniref:UbiA prenyltransferase n=1 Tax=Agaribacillus aureus TaxID=3051825 RepID=A0ABT8L4J3_9BACT|nr:hypothetical protein [Fulvivirgaceae bacterium BMA12]
MEVLIKIYRYLRILSVDVVMGACISAIFIANYIGVQIKVAPLFTLAICVWLIYTADHLIDAYHIKHKPHSLRHFYHKKYFRPLVYLFIIACSIGLISLAFLPGKTVFWGAILLVAIFTHFLLLKLIGIRPSIHKEFLVAIIYVSGIFLVPLSIYKGAINIDLWILYGQYLGLALINLLLFAVIEESIDKRDGHTSFVQFAGPKLTMSIIWVLLILSSLYPIYALIAASSRYGIVYQLIILAMSITLAIIAYKKEYFSKRERYRIYGDAIFLYPILVIGW